MQSWISHDTYNSSSTRLMKQVIYQRFQRFLTLLSSSWWKLCRYCFFGHLPKYKHKIQITVIGLYYCRPTRTRLHGQATRLQSLDTKKNLEIILIVILLNSHIWVTPLHGNSPQTLPIWHNKTTFEQNTVGPSKRSAKRIMGKGVHVY